jgi:hypothetical protein
MSENLNSKSSLRGGNANIKDHLKIISQALKLNDWETVANSYERISMIASSCQSSAEENLEGENNGQA